MGTIFNNTAHRNIKKVNNNKTQNETFDTWKNGHKLI